MSSDWKPRRQFVDPQKLSRKVFDKHVDQMEIKRKRDKDDLRADLKAIFRRMENLETQLTDLIEHVDRHCAELDTARAPREDMRDS